MACFDMFPPSYCSLRVSTWCSFYLDTENNDNAFQFDEVGLTIGRGVYFSTESKNYICFTPNAVANAPQFSYFYMFCLCGTQCSSVVAIDRLWGQRE